eukprot:1589514-Pyramimonas_sp.AAC.1
MRNTSAAPRLESRPAAEFDPSPFLREPVAAMTHAVGAIVEVVGLENRPELNGLFGVVSRVCPWTDRARALDSRGDPT